MSCFYYTDKMNDYYENNCDSQAETNLYYDEYDNAESSCYDHNIYTSENSDSYNCMNSDYTNGSHGNSCFKDKNDITEDTNYYDGDEDSSDDSENHETDEYSDSESDSVSNSSENEDADEYTYSSYDFVLNNEENHEPDEYDNSSGGSDSNYENTEEYSDSENDSVSNYEENQYADEYNSSTDDSNSNDEENHNPDEDFGSLGEQYDYDFAHDFDLYYEEEYDTYEHSELALKSNLDLGEVAIHESSMLLLFYENLLYDLVQKFFVNFSDVTNSLQLMTNSYRLVNCGHLPVEIDFNSAEYCIGYLHRYGACHMALVAEAVSTMLVSSSVLLYMVNKELLNVMFLGGGPGNDFVGFLTALYGHHQLLLLNVTIVDKMSGWKDVFTETVQKLQRGECYKASRIFQDVVVMPSFITSDLKEFSENCYDDKLKSADLVFFVKSLSHIPDAEKFTVLQNVVFHLKPGALLIYIDFPFPYATFAALQGFLRLVYQSNKTNYDFHLKSFKFGYPCISKCRAEVRVFERI